MFQRIFQAALAVLAGGLPLFLADRAWELPGWARLAALPVVVAAAVLAFRRNRPTFRPALAAALLSAAVLSAALLPREAANSWARLVLPLADIPLAREVRVALEPHGRVALWEGDLLRVTASVEGRTASGAPRLLREGEDGEAIAMRPVAGGAGLFEASLPAGTASFSLRAACGRARSRALRVDVLGRPRIRRASVQMQPPDYTGLDPLETEHASSDIACLAGSTLALEIQLDRPVAGLTLACGNLTRPFGGFADTWLAVAPLDEPGPYRVETAGAGAARQVLLACGNIAFFDDPGPRALLAGGNADCSAPLGGTLDVDLQAEDNIGLASLALELRAASGGNTVVIGSWEHNFPPGFTGLVTRRARLALSPDRFQAGAEYLLEAVARDFAPGNAPFRSPPRRLRVEAGR